MEWTKDPRIDPRIRAVFGAMKPRVRAGPTRPPDRASAVALAATPEEQKAHGAFSNALDQLEALAGLELLAPSAGIRAEKRSFVSSPDGNEIRVSVLRPEAAAAAGTPLPAVIYFHGGGMGRYSCFSGNFQAFGRLIASNGVGVVMVDFRNSLNDWDDKPAAESPETTRPFPAGLNDCCSAVRWVSSHRAELGLGGRLIVAGESGGGNLSLAAALKMKEEDTDGGGSGGGGGGVQQQLIHGIYAMCPFIGGQYPNPKFPSTTEHSGIVLDEATLNLYVAAYGDGLQDNILAWPSAAAPADLKGLPPVVVSVNEFDPLRDEGLDFYRKCLEAGVPARAQVLAGTVHATDNFFPGLCHDITAATARAIADFAKGGRATL